MFHLLNPNLCLPHCFQQRNHHLYFFPFLQVFLGNHHLLLLFYYFHLGHFYFHYFFHYRLAEKGYSQEEIENRELSQLPVQEKIKKADEIIYNNGSCKDLFKERRNW